MKRFFGAISRFFNPPAGSSALARLLPYVVVAFLVIVIVVFGTFTWEYTNQTKFCGLTCHTMPPQYQTQQRSPHANVTCEDCHLGRDVLAVMIPRKIEYSWQTGSAMLTNSYHYPIIARNMRPARDACENCHNPEKFSGDKLVELKRFAEDKANTLTSIYMLLKTGGGSKRQGLGFGIHWHVENPIYFYATDAERQNIPYVLVTRTDGSSAEYIDVEAKFDPKSIKKEDLQVMDCITCHNRTAHMISSPAETLDTLMGRGLVSPAIPDIRKKGAEVLGAKYSDQAQGLAAIAALDKYYQQNNADFYAKNTASIKAAITALSDAFTNTVFPDQKMDWATHPDNMQHKNSPGCFRCHDGKHLSPKGDDTVRLECNLCHSIPTISRSTQLVSNIPVSKGYEPENHKNPNWINLHRSAFDKSCQSCHTVEDPGGTSNQSFCSNGACHGADWKYAGFNAPKVREALKSQLPTPAPTPQPTPTPAAVKPTEPAAPTPTQAVAGGAPTFAQVGPVFEKACSMCHGDTGIKNVSLTSYAKTMGSGVITPGKPDESKLVRVQEKGGHPGQFSPEELALVKKWIAGGAVEK